MAFQSLYDEDLSENKFFAKLQGEHKILIETAPLENWIVCVPRSATIKPDHLNDTDFLLAHILIPHDEIAEQYTNLLGTDVKQLNGKLHLRSVASAILFEEIFYTKGLLKYKVWCIEWPLLSNGSMHDNNSSLHGSCDDSSGPNGIFIVRGLQDAIALIWNETNSKAIFRKIESVCCSFMKNTNCTVVEPVNCDGAVGEKNTPEILKRIKHSVDILLNHCFKKLMYQRRIYEKCTNDPHFRRVFKIALETYIMDLLYRWLFDAINCACADETEKFNRTLRNLSDATTKDFRIDSSHAEIIGRVRVELMKIPDLTTPIEKLSCLRRSLLHQCRHNNKLAVDDLLPILVFVIIKSGHTHWIATIHFLKNFIFTEFSDGSDKGVDSFLITTLEAAILYIQTIDLREFKKSTAPYNMFLATSETKSPLPPASLHRRRFVSKVKFIDYLFGKILAEDEVEIIKLLKTDKNVIINHGADKNDGVNCDRIGNGDDVKSNGNDDIDDDDDDSVVKSSSDTDSVDEGVVEEIDVISKFPESRLNLQNAHGIGGIHVAAMHGLPKMLNALLALGVDLHIKDENNYTALHYAASRGHQNTLLLLLHAGAEINATTNDKSTALHLSSLYGHSNCVKALLYYSDHMKVRIDRNAQTRAGDTALHLASKWGFNEIIDTLLEYGVRVDIRNRGGHTAIELAHNSQIVIRLQNAIAAANHQQINVQMGGSGSSWPVGPSQSGRSNFRTIATTTPSTTAASALATTTPSTAIAQNHELFRGCFSTGLKHTINTLDAVTMLKYNVNDKIVAAIKNADTKLACHFLGIELPDDDEADAVAAQTICHPLCDCTKCKHITEYLSRKSNRSTMQLAHRTYDGNLDECSTDGMTPLHAAIQMNNLDLVEKILQLGAKVNVPVNQTHQTAIHLAILSKSIAILNVVLNHLEPIQAGRNRNDLDVQDANGDTALHLAIRLGDVKLIDALLKYEPNIHIKNRDRKTAIEIAKSLLQLTVVQRLEHAESNDLRNIATYQNKSA